MATYPHSEPPPAVPTLTVPLRISVVREAACTEPLTVGVPVARGQLPRAARGEFVTAAGQSFPAQLSPLAFWPDGSIKWLLAETLASDLARCSEDWSLVLSPVTGPASAASIDVRPAGDTISVMTGTHRFTVGCAAPRGDAVRVESLDGRLLGTLELSIIDQRSRAALVHWRSVELEHAGALRSTIGLVGDVARHQQLEVRLSLSCFANTGLARVECTLHNARAAHHPGGLWDLGDSGSWLFREVALRYHAAAPASSCEIRLDDDQTLDLPPSASGALVQHSSGGRNWRSRNHVDRNGRVPLSRWGYQWQGAGRAVIGGRAEPVFVRRSAAETLLVAVPEFWQQFPKSLSLMEKEVAVGFFPGEHGEPFELQGGERKRHVAWLEWTNQEVVSPARLAWVHQPAHLAATPAWHEESGAWPCMISAKRDPDDRLAIVTSQAIAGPQSFFAKREAIDEYGWRHFGEVWGDHEGAFFSGSGPVISHYNNQFDLLLGTLLQWLRTGDDAWRQVADPLARHIVDIDIYHTSRDKPAYCGGLFWHTDHYVSAATATHRTYSRYNLRGVGKGYGGGPSNEHNYATGLLFYHYVTGDPAARAAVIELADWVMRMDDGRLAPWAWLDDGPTGAASRTREDDYHGPGRGAGNSVNVLLDAWELTRSRPYLDFAETLIRRCIHPDDDIDQRDLLDVERRWSYTVFLVALSCYLAIKTAESEYDRGYDYARQSLLHYARWMIGNERLTLDRPEQLQYVTETWAAQDLRKANVLRLAAAFAPPELAQRCRAKGEELADSAWLALLSFPSVHVTRAIAITAIEGTRDYYLRQESAAATPSSVKKDDFGMPQVFIPARRRIKQKLTTLSGWKDIARRLAQQVSRMFVQATQGRHGN